MVGETLLIDKTEVCGKCNGVDSNKCLYCKGTGIGDPPHHFREECDGEIPQKKSLPDMSVESKSNSDEEITLLRNEIESLGGTYDRRWSIGSLQKHILLLKKDKKEA